MRICGVNEPVLKCVRVYRVVRVARSRRQAAAAEKGGTDEKQALLTDDDDV
jgi:hypothetical protein